MLLESTLIFRRGHVGGTPGELSEFFDGTNVSELRDGMQFPQTHVIDHALEQWLMDLVD